MKMMAKVLIVVIEMLINMIIGMIMLPGIYRTYLIYHRTSHDSYNKITQNIIIIY